MSGPNSQLPIRLLRRVLLAALVIFVGIMAALLVSRRTGGPEAVEETQDRGDGLVADLAELVLSGEGFDYEVTDGPDRLFHISAARVVSDREEMFGLEQVVIAIARPSGTTLEVSADKGLYQDEERVAKLEGNAVISRSDGLTVRSQGFELRRKGRMAVSTAPVRFQFNERLQGRARKLEAYLRKDRFVLSGKVRIGGGEDDPSLSLSCKRLIYEDSERMIHAEGDVILRHRGNTMRARRLSVTLAAEDSTVRFARARWNVSGEQRLADEEAFGNRMSYAAESVSVAFDERGEVEKLELDAGRNALASLVLFDDTGLARKLTSSYLVAGFDDGQPRLAEAFHPVRVREYFLSAPAMQRMAACANTAVATFDRAGDLETMTLNGKVELHQPNAHTVGEQLVMEEATGSVVVTGDPASVYTRRGRLQAPALSHRQETNRLIASGGVRADLESTDEIALLGSGEGNDEPVRITSRSAEWNPSSSSFAFIDDVRAWQGVNFLVASRLESEDEGGKLVASGDVKTVFTSGDDGGGEAEAPVEVTAGRLVYQRAERVATYTESPRARQTGRSLSGEQLALFLATDSGDLERLVCTGSVVLNDPGEGRSVRGEQAVFTPDDQLVEVDGQPAVMTEPGGGQVRGAKIVYDLENGTAQVSSGAAEKRGALNP